MPILNSRRKNNLGMRSKLIKDLVKHKIMVRWDVIACPDETATAAEKWLTELWRNEGITPATTLQVEAVLEGLVRQMRKGA